MGIMHVISLGSSCRTDNALKLSMKSLKLSDTQLARVRILCASRAAGGVVDSQLEHPGALPFFHTSSFFKGRPKYLDEDVLHITYLPFGEVRNHGPAVNIPRTS